MVQPSTEVRLELYSSSSWNTVHVQLFTEMSLVILKEQTGNSASVEKVLQARGGAMGGVNSLTGLNDKQKKALQLLPEAGDLVNPRKKRVLNGVKDAFR